MYARDINGRHVVEMVSASVLVVSYVLPCMCFCPGIGFGQSRQSGPAVRVVRIDGSQQRGEWLGAKRDSVEIQVERVPTEIPWNDLMLVAFDGAAASRPATPGSGEVVCTLADGGVIRGELAASADGTVQLKTTALGDITLRFADLAGIRLGSVEENPRAQGELDKWLSKRPAGNDVLIAVHENGVTAVRGALVAIGPEGGQFTVGGRTLPLRANVAYAVVFGGGLSSPASAPSTIGLRDGSRVAATIAKADSAALTCDLTGGAGVSVPIAEVQQIAVRSPRVTFASDLTPSEAKFEPFLDTPWPHRLDRAVSNRPLRLGGVEYLKGLGVHSRSELAFDLDGKYGRFAATIGIDDFVRPRGNVVFRVFADDREAFNSGAVTGKDEPRPILVDIAGAKRVRLIVEFGEELDLADHADWANARFIR